MPDSTQIFLPFPSLMVSTLPPSFPSSCNVALTTTSPPRSFNSLNLQTLSTAMWYSYQTYLAPNQNPTFSTMKKSSCSSIAFARFIKMTPPAQTASSISFFPFSAETHILVKQLTFPAENCAIHINLSKNTPPALFTPPSTLLALNTSPS